MIWQTKWPVCQFCHSNLKKCIVWVGVFVWHKGWELCFFFFHGCHIYHVEKPSCSYGRPRFSKEPRVIFCVAKHGQIELCALLINWTHLALISSAQKLTNSSAVTFFITCDYSEQMRCSTSLYTVHKSPNCLGCMPQSTSLELYSFSGDRDSRIIVKSGLITCF